MFEITGNDITDLSDSDLRSLVTRLVVAELRKKGYPLSSLTAGGNQDAPDGGLDVRVECSSDISNPDFVPRRLTGFQVKRPDMPRGAILEEMRPNGALRDVIRDIADSSGAYVIVSSQGSVADKPLAERRKAMRDALKHLSTASQLHTDFYDRERLATWANEYSGVTAWVRSRVGRPLSGWSGIGDWEGGCTVALKPYLFNDKACLIDERSSKREALTTKDGIERLRVGLCTPKQCIRLIGLSGLGKTRLVQALFEEGVGEDPLDSSIAVYTDYSEETSPTARDMARELIARRQRAILVVDNCNPSTHSELARLCASEASEVSLITIEYDVRDDEPERTDVFRLQAASSELLTEWIKQNFPDISQIDRDKIAEFSDGNFRVARALAETLGKGETLGSLKNRELFERIFHQGKPADNQILRAAEDLSLLYSIDGEDVSEQGELARVGAISGVDAQPLYEALVWMSQRGVVQSRGRFRAILPQAITNRLAAHALDRIHPANFDRFCGTLTPRMLKSVSRRLGFLHDSTTAQTTVARWLRTDGPLGNLITMGEEGFQIISNIAPVAPEAVLTKLEMEIDGPNGLLSLAPTSSKHSQWVPLIKAIGYDANFFDRVITILARILASQPERDSSDSTLTAFSECFYMSLSGTQAAPRQRCAAIKRLAVSDDDGLRRCSKTAIGALIKSDNFMSMGNYDFGARSRDWGWYPKNIQDFKAWLEEAISLVIELMPESEARVLLAGELRSLWFYPSCFNALDRAATIFAQTSPWIEGWIASRVALRLNGKNMPEEARSKLVQFIERLKPTDLLNQARAVVLNRMSGGGGWDFADGECGEGDAVKAYENADKMAQEIGCALANDSKIRAKFIAELLLEPYAMRAFQCGRGLAEGSDDLHAMWSEIVMGYDAAKSQSRNATLLGGFICEAHQRDHSFTSHALEAAMSNTNLLLILPYLQQCAGIDMEGIARLRRAIEKGGLVALNFKDIANSSVSNSPPEPLAALLNDIAKLPKGVEVAIEILHMHFYRSSNDGLEKNELLVSVGRDLLSRVNFTKDSHLKDYGTHAVIGICLMGEEGENAAVRVCANICSALDRYSVLSHNLMYTLKALFETQPAIALDSFLLPSSPLRNSCRFDRCLGTRSPIENLNPEILKQWADHDPEVRYPLLGKCLSMFPEKGDEENDLSPLFVSLLKQAPDKRLFLGDMWDRLHPRSWGGSLADILTQRKALLLKLSEHAGEQVGASVADILPELDRWIASVRGSERVAEESFE
jgi:hypothetical protein